MVLSTYDANLPIDFEKMASDLERIASQIRSKPALNHHFAERIDLLARQIREETRQELPA